MPTNDRGEQVSNENQPEKEGRRDMPMPAATEADEDVVQVSTRVPRSVRKRLRMAAAQADVSIQDIQKQAFEQFLQERDL